MSSLSKQAAKLTRGDGDFDAESLSHKPDTIDEVDRESDVSGSHVSAEDFQEESSGPAEIAQKENQLVKYSKIFVIVVILCVAAIMGYLTHRYISNQEDEDHKQQFANVANDIIVSSAIRARGIFNNLEAVSASLTDSVMLMNATWPFVNFPNFQVTGMVSNEITGAYTSWIAPLVTHEQRYAFQNYSLRNQWWMDQGHMYDKMVAEDLYVEERYYDEPPYESPFPLQRYNETGIFPFIWTMGERGPAPVPDTDLFFPVSQAAPAEDFMPLANIDLYNLPGSGDYVKGVLALQKPVLTVTTRADYLPLSYDRRFSRSGEALPHTYIYQPIFDTFRKDRKLVGILAVFLPWDQFFMDILPESERGVYVLLKGTCDDQRFTFQLSGRDVEFVGEGDLHESDFSDTEKFFEFAPFSRLEPVEGAKSCAYTVKIYSSEEYSNKFFTNKPYLFAGAVVGCFLLTTLVFVIYDIVVSLRQKKVMESANKTNAIVSQLFPANVRDRMLEELAPEPKKKPASLSSAWMANQHQKFSDSAADSSMSNTMGDMSEFEGSSGGAICPATSEKIFGSKPIADLFPNTTILFADLVGFTAWSSTREPQQVFTLLETIYHGFDQIAKRRRVFKVETVGDCYVACAGLPMPRKDHALIMCRFANEILEKMHELSRRLETVLGPDTADLDLRIGLHSGPVTAGVLRGEKGRFQLFGDTMNTASRMESNGAPNRIHISKATAELVQKAGKGKWLIERVDKIVAKGKGELQTYWLQIREESRHSSNTLANGSVSGLSSLGGNDIDDSSSRGISDARKNLLAAIGTSEEDYAMKTERLIQWNVEILAGLLRQVMARRASRPNNFIVNRAKNQRLIIASGGKVLNEVVDILSLPQFNESIFKNHVDPNTIQLSSKVMNQLTDYVRKIAAGYRNNYFHNFEHASHVTMSVNKLLSRIINPNEISKRHKDPEYKVASDLHDHTFGITSDPLTQFAAVMSALIHDVDHLGVPNATLVKEKDPLAIKYDKRSIAEQNSVDIAWSLLMSSEYKDLHRCIWENEDEHKRFRQLIVNIVMATDIMDKDLKVLRNARWEKAFKSGEDGSSGSSADDSKSDGTTSVVNRKATIVLEHLIQASDVCHTMQHWHVYRKWNERLFREMYQAYLDGRIDKDPSESWYEGEIGFFDFYIIPLAKKLETCGVFGVSSHEYLTYAQANRQEWVERGQDMVKHYMRKMGSFVESEGDEYDLLLEEASASKKVVVVGDTAEC